MTKKQLVARVAQIGKISKGAAKRAVDIVFDGMREELAEGGKVEIRGFGSLQVRSYEEYITRNPRTGERIKVKLKRLPHFKAAKEMKERLNAS
jgi:integration host factor subunit beta